VKYFFAVVAGVCEREREKSEALHNRRILLAVASKQNLIKRIPSIDRETSFLLMIYFYL